MSYGSSGKGKIEPMRHKDYQRNCRSGRYEADIIICRSGSRDYIFMPLMPPFAPFLGLGAAVIFMSGLWSIGQM